MLLNNGELKILQLKTEIEKTKRTIKHFQKKLQKGVPHSRKRSKGLRLKIQRCEDNIKSKQNEINTIKTKRLIGI